MMNIESLWKEYVSFEQSINPMIAEKLTQERSRDYMNARRVAKEYEAVTRGLNKTHPSVPPTGKIHCTELDLNGCLRHTGRAQTSRTVAQLHQLGEK